MKILLFLSVLVGYFSQKSLGQTNDIETLKKLNAAWLNSYPKRDSATLSSILADDFVLIAVNGAKQTKKDNLDNLLSPNIETISVSIDNVDVRMLSSDVGLLTAYTNFVFKMDGKEMTGKNCYMDVYQKRKGKWVAVAAHVTSLSSQ